MNARGSVLLLRLTSTTDSETTPVDVTMDQNLTDARSGDGSRSWPSLQNAGIPMF